MNLSDIFAYNMLVIVLIPSNRRYMNNYLYFPLKIVLPFVVNHLRVTPKIPFCNKIVVNSGHNTRVHDLT